MDARDAGKFWSVGCLGFYLRVELEGTIERDPHMNLVDKSKHSNSIRNYYEIVTGGTADEAENLFVKLRHLDTGWIRRLRQVCKPECGALGRNTGRVC